MLACTGLTASAADAELDLARFRGKVVLVDFWASWCAPCRQSFPWLNRMHAKYRDRGLVVIGINVDREGRDAERFLKQTPDGELAGVHIGFRNGTRAEGEAELERLLSGLAASAHTQ